MLAIVPLHGFDKKLEICKGIIFVKRIFLIFIILTLGCGGGGGGESRSTKKKASIIGDILFFSSEGEQKRTLPEKSPVIISLRNYKPKTQYDIKVYRENGGELSYLRITTDTNGNTPKIIILHRGDFLIGNYYIKICEVEGSICKDATPDNNTFSAIEKTTFIEICDESGSTRRRFFPGEKVYVKGALGIKAADKDVYIYVLRDRFNWRFGDILTDVDSPEMVHTDSDGNIPLTPLWEIPEDFNPASSKGNSFDIAVDVDGDGRFSDGDFLYSNFTEAFTVQVQDIPSDDLYLQLSCNEDMINRDYFLTNSTIYIHTAPLYPLNPSKNWVKVYITRHKSCWLDGDTLAGISPWNANIIDDETDEVGIFMVLSPPIKPGDYDIVLDVNGNGVYDRGIDILDGGGMGPGFTVVDPSSITKKKWTVMVYMDGDQNVGDLSPYAYDDLNEMEKVGSSNDVNIVVQMDTTSDTTKRYYVEYGNSKLIRDMGELNMGDYRTLMGFVEWASLNYPADHYLLILWNHGEGFRVLRTDKDICFDDDPFLGDSINIPDLGWALREIKKLLGKKIDVLGMDACLMGMVEVAYEVMDGASYIVFSENTVPSDGWPYDDILSFLTQHPDTPPDEVSKEIVNRFVDFYTPNDDVTLSALYLDRIKDIVQSVNDLSNALLSNLDTIKSTLLGSIFQNVQRFDDGLIYGIDPEDDSFVDLYHLADLIENNGNMTEDITEKAATIMDKISQAIILSRTSDDGLSDNEVGAYDMRNSRGISIWFPGNNTFYPSYIDKYSRLLFSRDTSWLDLLFNLYPD